MKSRGRHHRALRGAIAIALPTLLLAAGGALATVHLSAGSAYTANSSVCHRPTLPGTTCVYRFRAVRGGYALRFVGHTVVSSWACRRGGGQALIGGNVAGNVPVPLLKLQSNGTLSGSVGRGPKKVSAAGHIAEAGTKAVFRLRLAKGHCSGPKVTLFEGSVPPHRTH